MPFQLAALLRKMSLRDVSRGPLGVDIGSCAVKLLRWSGKPGIAPDYAMTALPAGAVTDRNIRDAEAVGRCIAEAAASLRMPGKEAVTAAPSSLVMQRTLQWEPEMTDAEVEAQILVEADRYIPYPIDEARTDFSRLHGPEYPPGSILLSVCRKEHIDSRERAIERAWRLLGPSPMADELAAVADLGAGATRLYVLADGRSIYSRESPWGERSPESFVADAVRQIGQTLQLFGDYTPN